MYKAKKRIWIFFILLSVLIYNFSSVKSFFQELTQKTVYNTYVDTKEFSFISKIDGYSKKGAKLKVIETQSNANIVIKNASNEDLPGFIKYEKQFYSPIIMFVPEDAKSLKNSGFLTNTHGSGLNSYTYVQKDLKIILEAIEESKTYTEIGIPKQVFGEGKVTLAIPNKNSECYDEIVELITLTLCDYNESLKEDAAIQKRVNNILKKCESYEDATQYIENICVHWLSDKPIVLAPEYICINSSYLRAGNNSSYISCIPLKTMNIYYDLYIKNVEDNSFYDELFTSLQQKKFIDKTGLRNKDRDFNLYDSTYFHYNTNSIPALN